MIGNPLGEGVILAALAVGGVVALVARSRGAAMTTAAGLASRAFLLTYLLVGVALVYGIVASVVVLVLLAIWVRVFSIARRLLTSA